MTQQVITAFFDSRADANRAMDELVKAGIPRASIRLMPETETSSTSMMAPSSYDPDNDEKGFWASLGELFLPDEDRYTYAEAMHRGSIMVSATVDAAHVERAEDILETYGTVDIDEREASWRNEGWGGYTAAPTSAGVGMAPSTQTGTTGATAMSSAATSDEVVPVVEEQLRIGKRQVNKGRVRIRSYVIETPVQEQVNLRQEHVQVERRPVDRPVTADDEALFRERTIEAAEHSEEAIVSKEARVKEELVIHKDIEERTQVVQDKLRRTEAEIEDDRAANRVASSKTDPGTRQR
jgi:uncharacterized protein (TIGR02271 family)